MVAGKSFFFSKIGVQSCVRFRCTLLHSYGSYAMLVNDDEQLPEGGRSFFCNISEHSSARDFDKVPVS